MYQAQIARNTIANLPRDVRDTVFLLCVVAWIILPQLGTLPVWASALALAMLLWRGAIAVRRWPLPSRWVLLALLAMAVGLTVATFKTIVGPAAGVTLVVMLLALKTLELRSRRDAMVVFFLGFFTMLSNFFQSQSLLTALAILLGLVGLLTALVTAHMPVGRPAFAQAAGLALRMMLIGAPLTVALFLLFPRMAPLWGVPMNDSAGKSGLSDEMEVGSVASLAMDEAIAFRIRFLTPGNQAPPLSALYFRGPVLSHFDGRRWSGSAGVRAHIPRPAGDLQVQGEPIAYDMTLEASKRGWLLPLDLMTEAPALPRGRGYATADLQWISSQPVNEVTRIRMQSHLNYRFGMQAGAQELARNRQLPHSSSPRTRAWVQQLQAELASSPDPTQALVERLLAQLRGQGYRYTLEPGTYGAQAADEFWFDRKEGFCEHIASAFVIALRAAGVPARIVTGYQGGTINSVDGYWTVRQADAHAWAEVWMGRERGWLRVDPTGAVMPGRVGTGQRLAAPQGMFGSAITNPVALGTFEQLRAVWEAVNNGWNQWVLNYTQRDQMNLLRSWGMETPDWQDLVRLLGGLFAAAALVTGGVVLWRKRHADPWLALLQRARAELERRGIETPASATPRALARQLRELQGDGARPFAAWLRAMERWRYGGEADASTTTLRQLQKQFKTLPWNTLKGQARKV
ncbi:protein-glutamine gamma-glutamyltransferase TgpA [Comamonas humi]